MNYLFFSRIIYSVPFLIYILFNINNFTQNNSLEYLIIWSVLFLLSIVFFSLSNKLLPFSLIHFIFILESYLLLNISLNFSDYNIMLFLLLSSFYTIESLRNDFFNIIIHLFIITSICFLINTLYGINFYDIPFNQTSFEILGSLLICRAIMSSIESKDVIIKEIIKKKSILVPYEDEDVKNKENIMNRKINFFKEQNKNLKKDFENVVKEKEKIKIEYDSFYNKSLKSQELNKDIAHSYFVLLANMRFDLNRTFEENIINTLNVFKSETKASYVALFLKDDENNSISLVSSVKRPDINFSDETFASIPSIIDNIKESFKKNKCEFQSTNNSAIDEAIYPLSNILYAPISLNKDIKGVLIQAFDNSYNNNIHFFNLALMVAYHIYNALQNENLYKQAKDESNIDGLTKAHNKKYFLERLPLAFNGTYNYGGNLALIFIDVDYFKQVNDTYGHDKGDDLLINIVKLIRDNIRKSDIVFRYGGDEFIVLMNSTNKEKLENFCCKINESLKDLNITVNINNECKPISLSMGAYIYIPEIDNVSSANELLKKADEALYISKKTGKGKLYIDQ